MTDSDKVTFGSAHPSTLWLSLLPAGVCTAEMRTAGDPALLNEAERASVAKAVPKRLQEFAAGRLCARRALADLGVDISALPAGPDRVPIWPAGVVGSISHTDGYCAAVVGRRRQFAGLGIDVEGSHAVGNELWEQLCTMQELEQLYALPPERRLRAAALIYSAKEAFYKCQYPQTTEWLEFTDIRIEPDGWQLEAGGFIVQPMRQLRLDVGRFQALRGQFCFRDGLVASGIALISLVVPEDLERG